ncbi:MAG: DegT/DnrJ/EryC1/StrS family aminotransferase [Anaerolineae bacterium]
MKVPITKPYFGQAEKEAVQKPLESGWVVQGPYVQEFEQKFAAFTGSQHAVAVSTCTAALHIAVAMLGVKPGDEVIVPAFTWISTANIVEYLGGTPVFCDIDLRTFNIAVEQMEACLTSRTVGFIPVHLFGLCADMDGILELARAHDLWVVEDAACGLGAWYHGAHAGTLGDVGCFSFHPRKSITTGEGGMLTVQDENLDQLARSLRDHGASRSDLHRHHKKAGFLLAEYNHLGYNYRLTDLQGAVGAVQMDRVDWVLRQRRRLALKYDEQLADLDWLETPVVPEGYLHGYQSYVCLFRPTEPTLENVSRLHEWRNALMLRMEERGVATRQGTHAPVIQNYYMKKYGFTPDQFPKAFLADRLSLALPLYPQMTEVEQGYVVETLKKAFQMSG